MLQARAMSLVPRRTLRGGAAVPVPLAGVHLQPGLAGVELPHEGVPGLLEAPQGGEVAPVFLGQFILTSRTGPR
jgi:hypothetical protein